MKFINALINSTAVWFALKAVEVVPFAIYDVFTAVKGWKENRVNPDTTEGVEYGNRYDSRRGKLEYVFAGQGFAEFRVFQKSKKWFFISTIVPVFIFALELFSIVLGNEVNACETSTDTNIVSAPALQLFGEGEREISIEELNKRIMDSGTIFRPCFTQTSRHNGVDYVASVCSETFGVSGAAFLAKTLFPDKKWISVTISKETEAGHVFVISVFSKPLKETFENASFIGAFAVSSEVVVGGKSVLQTDVTKDGILSETHTRRIRSDVKVLEETFSFAPSEYWESEYLFGFQWGNLEDFKFGIHMVIPAVLAQARSTGMRALVETLTLSTPDLFQPVEISCREDFILSRNASIAVISIAVVLRILYLAVPSSLSSAEFASIASQDIENGNELSVLPFFMDRKRTVYQLTS